MVTEENRPMTELTTLQYRAGIFKQSMGAGNRVEVGLSNRSARLHRLAELILWNRFLNSGSVCTSTSMVKQEGCVEVTKRNIRNVLGCW